VSRIAQEHAQKLKGHIERLYLNYVKEVHGLLYEHAERLRKEREKVKKEIEKQKKKK